MRKMGSKVRSLYDFLPMTFILPQQYMKFMEMFTKYYELEGDKNIWIMKPSAKSRGRGIQLVNQISQVAYQASVVLQRYIKNPLLIRGYKFDLRIYVLLTSIKPLEIYLYKEGFARFSTETFSLNVNQL